MNLAAIDSMDDVGIIDAHVHFWNPERHPDILTFGRFPELKRPFSPHDFAQNFTRHNIKHAVIVQSEPTVTHSDDCAKIAAQDKRYHSMGWVDINAFDLNSLKQFRERHVGFRVMLNRLPAAVISSKQLDALCDLAGQAGLAVDILATIEHLKIVTRLTHAAPNTRLILNHSAQPDTSSPPTTDWSIAMHKLGQHRSFYNKLSGLIEKSKGNRDAVNAHISTLYGCQSPDNLIFASNWPIIDHFSHYDKWVETVRDGAVSHGLNSQAQERLMSGTAKTAFQI